MTDKPTATFEGLLRRYPAFRELGDAVFAGLHQLPVLFIAPSGRSCPS